MDFATIQKTQTWGNQKTIQFQPPPTGSVTLTSNGTGNTGQLVYARVETPVIWLVQWMFFLEGFTGELNPVTVNLATTFGVGQTSQTIRQGIVVTAPYSLYPSTSPYFDQGQIPSDSLTITGEVSGGPFSQPEPHVISFGVAAAPWKGEGDRYDLAKMLGELREMVAELRMLRAGTITRMGGGR